MWGGRKREKGRVPSKGKTVATEFKLPELGENIESGDVVRVAVSPGETVHEGQTVVELETDKAVVEVPSTVNGKIDQVSVQRSQKVKAGDVLFTYTPDNDKAAAPEKPQRAEQAPSEGASAPETTAPEETAAETPAPESPVPEAPAKERAPAKKIEKKVSSPSPAAQPRPTARPREQAAQQSAKPPAGAASSELRLPELGENIESGDVVRVNVQPGEQVSEGQTVLELETDKAVVEVPSSLSGTVNEVKVQTGQKLKVGDLILTITGAEQKTAEQETAPAAPAPDVLPEADLHVHPRGVVRHAGHEHRTVPAAPIVRKLAREIGVDVYLVKGSGPGGRITEDDVKAFAKAVFAQLAESRLQGAVRPELAKLPDFSRWGKVEKVSLRAVRRKTAEHVSLAWNVIPHVTQFDKADVSELEELRKRFAPKAEKAGGKMTMTAIALKVVASALKAFPQFNASIDIASEEIIYKRYINVGVAVDTERGLLVPVIRDVDKKNIIDLAVELSAISKKAHDKKLAPEDMEGGTFTITNLGGVGGTSFTPIVNYPEVAILGISRAHSEPVWNNDKFEPRSMLPLSLSYDHRMIDGADAARFLRWIVDALEQPFLLSVQG